MTETVDEIIARAILTENGTNFYYVSEYEAHHYAVAIREALTSSGFAIVPVDELGEERSVYLTPEQQKAANRQKNRFMATALAGLKAGKDVG